MRKPERKTSTAKLNHDQKRTTIISAAIDMIEKEGLLKFNVKKLAVNCGVSKPSVYYYFDDERDILRSVYRELLARECIYLRSNGDSELYSNLPMIRDVQAFIGGAFDCEELNDFHWALSVFESKDYLRSLVPGASI